ncbi:transcriptional repressor [Candidatus Gracilibacteria bacterium]|nr:transcriptional repressor [Candidatus Gracilibacteria bacterium]
MTDFLDQVTNFFVTKKWRLTPGVRNIVEILSKTNIPLAVREIEKKLDSKERSVDPTTVYRILERLKKANLVHDLHGKFIRCTDPNSKHEHHFLICEKCGNAEEIFLDYRESIAKQLAREKDFVLKEVDLSFWGTCKDCTQK